MGDVRDCNAVRLLCFKVLTCRLCEVTFNELKYFSTGLKVKPAMDETLGDSQTKAESVHDSDSVIQGA